ncbi:MAG: 2-amino-4-hydroxy-6-hydroxymethyldihydropteridine diphosphokinase [Anaerolineales bacterium]|nr:2-amino-4-hydroxy-6-hydroxymethyldihydropteridine diphosphokinase [Anaerolineales bacterium]MCB8951830.1 2-amino-4-hydroxy-6-hydroxymethyldihydropteridine diphosphokinase [Ardenticatenales bacterium]
MLDSPLRQQTECAPICYLGLGSNLGQREVHLRQAIKLLRAFMVVSAISPVYETPPWGVVDQPDFLNICVAGSTHLPPLPLLSALKRIENEMGRRATYRWGPRLIDIDLLFYGDLILETERLTIPHPHLAARAFVLAPLADIAPGYLHPQTKNSVAEMLAEVDQTGLRRLAAPLFAEDAHV